MRFYPILVCVAILGTSRLQAQSGNYLNIAMLTLPPKWLADIPSNQRTALLKELSSYDSNHRLDYQNGYLDFYSDSEEPDAPQASSMFYLKLLPTSGFDPVVFVHMQKPFNGANPSADDTHVLEQEGDG